MTKHKSKPATKRRRKPAPSAAARARAARENTLRCNLYMSASDLKEIAFARIETLDAVTFLRAIITAEMLRCAARLAPSEITRQWDALENFTRETLSTLA